jgi:magnesium transporter
LEKYIGSNKWKWVQLNKNEIDRVQLPIEQEDFVNDWLKHVSKIKRNCLRVDGLENGGKILKGSLIYKQNLAEERDYKIFHFYLTTDLLVTVDLELTSLKQINPEVLLRLVDRTENAVDGFLLYLGELMNEMLVGIDQFEETFNTLIWSVRKRNKTGILEIVFKCRHELLVWKNLLIPMNEVKMAIDEINFHGISKRDIFTRTCKRIERAMVLLNEYEHEMDSIINLEEVISSHRGNEIMKTLTVITTIFTPIMAFGALWGMNFQHMPELEWRFGYILSILLITISTLLLYGYLKIKGWTGDLLKGKKKSSFTK